METTHSKTGRTKKPAPKIVVNGWDDVWQSFNQSRETVTVEEMNAKGWKTVEQASTESGYSANYINALALRGKRMELEKHKVNRNGRIMEMNFVRPKI